MSTARKPLLEFPCSFPLKAIGRDRDDFQGFVLSVVQRHIPELAEGAVAARPSHGGKYLAVTVSFTAQSQEQLDALYRELSLSERVLMLL